MIPFSPQAKRQLDELCRHYAERGRDAAIDNLVDSLEHACARYVASHGLFHDAPRPYPALLRPGWRWTKEGRYWIAFGPAKAGPVVRAVLYEAANMPNRLG